MIPRIIINVILRWSLHLSIFKSLCICLSIEIHWIFLLGLRMEWCMDLPLVIHSKDLFCWKTRWEGKVHNVSSQLRSILVKCCSRLSSIFKVFVIFPMVVRYSRLICKGLHKLHSTDLKAYLGEVPRPGLLVFMDRPWEVILQNDYSQIEQQER